MKKLHLLCNAHLDPAWLWRWNEGLAEAISTFRVAADFCEKYDGFVFNHNEALLYEWVEEHEPQLFERIKKLVKEKKWTIMGGWYLQPDCVMTSGESLLEQINLGQEYFMSRFGIKPDIAINFDSFGHSRGLEQILKLTGYKGYIFMRPYEIKGDFLWEGYDGSRIIAHGTVDGYNSLKGQALKKIQDNIKLQASDTGLCLWGIGNHGGGPSQEDLENINRLISTSDIEMIHSTADAYISEVNTDNLKVIDKSLIPCMVGCYTSMVRIKQANRRLENKIAVTEKILNYAQMLSDFQYDENELKKAKKALAFCQFHDILPGSAIRPVEEDSIKTLNYGEDITDKLYTKGFLKLCEGQKKAADGEIPIMVFNPHPYEIEGEFEVGFMLQNQNWNEDEITLATVYDENGNELLTQNEKPESTFNLDWIEKVSFVGKIAPSSISRFNCKFTILKKDSLPQKEYDEKFISVSNERMNVVINRDTGLIDLYEIDGKRYIENSGKIEVYKDNEDPWGMKVDSFKEYEGSFKLMSDKEANDFTGYPEENFSNVRVIEDGPVRMKVQAIFKYKRSVAVVEYTLPKNGVYIDVEVLMYSNETNKMYKYVIDTKLNGTPYGETAFGCEELYNNESEAVYHKWCGIKEAEDSGLYIVNKGIYGGSFTNSTIKLSLLRTPIYSAHPIGNRQIAPHNRFIKHIDMGERKFSFRITPESDIARQAQIYNEEPQLLSFFPSGDGSKSSSVIAIDNPHIILSSFKKKNNKYELTLFNASPRENTAEISLLKYNKNIKIEFKKYEIKQIQI
ncbi:MAG: alpha-mannosidase [Oscillospiraceae bacterium]|nr:alpha-mannosidase [Oscillospiraceae bacterium]